MTAAFVANKLGDADAPDIRLSRCERSKHCCVQFISVFFFQEMTRLLPLVELLRCLYASCSSHPPLQMTISSGSLDSHLSNYHTSPLSNTPFRLSRRGPRATIIASLISYVFTRRDGECRGVGGGGVGGWGALILSLNFVTDIFPQAWYRRVRRDWAPFFSKMN